MKFIHEELNLIQVLKISLMVGLGWLWFKIFMQLDKIIELLQ